jgi:lactate dehydrogenase-like 2-hydroxyacid dehydrogenase
MKHDMSERPVVLVCRKLPAAVEARLERDYDARFNAQDLVYSSDQILALAEGAHAIIPCHTEKLSADVISRLPASVRAICSFSVGYDHIDLEAAGARGISVTNTPEVLNDATAEIAMLLLLAAARRAHECAQMLRSDTWADWSAVGQLGIQVTGKRLGIIGMGRVGQIMARRARGFDMEIHYHNRTRLEPALEQGANFHESINTLLPYCDFLSIHCPATPETHHLINKNTLALLPRQAVVINTARGAVVKDADLIEALQKKRIFAAGLDVFNNEPDIDARYRKLDNAFLLPHIGSATRETRDAMGFRALDNLDAIMSGQEPQDRLI